MEFTKTNRGCPKLLYEGYAYVVNVIKNGICFWRCDKRGICNATIGTLNNEVCRQPTDHSHPSDPSRIISIKTVQEIKFRAKNTEEHTSTIIQNCTSIFPLDAAGSLPKKETLSRMIRRERKLPDGDELTDELKLSLRGDNFILYESQDMVIMATDRNLDCLQMSEHWFSDGTFDVAPLGFQLYTIHCLLVNSSTVPLVYILANNRSKESYDFIFSTLKSRRQLDPVSITVDFERSAIISIRENFPDTQINGCFFHFGQCIWRNIQTHGLQTWYNTPSNSLFIKSIQALAFCPSNDVINLFNDLCDSLDEDTSILLNEFLAYFERVWLGEPIRRRSRRNPIYSVSIWSVYHRTINDLPRTNNSVEGWHNAFQKIVGVSHPSRCKLVSKIRKQQSQVELTIIHALSGTNPRNSKTKYQELSRKLKVLVDGYDVEKGIEFLRAIAHNI